jgi:hypothetical protein
MTRHPFRVAVEADDEDAIVELLHEDVEFRSPAVHRPYHGRESWRTCSTMRRPPWRG